jgi:hypothetical protein
MNDGATVRLAGAAVVASRLAMGVSKDQNRPLKAPDESRRDGLSEGRDPSIVRLCREVSSSVLDENAGW